MFVRDFGIYRKRDELKESRSVQNMNSDLPKLC